MRIEGASDSSSPLVVTVAPDGNLLLPLVGEVAAGGRTLRELSEDLTRRYARYVREPDVVVVAEVVGSDAEELRRAFSFGDRQGLELTVDPSGMINVPRLGPVRVAGRSADDVAAELTALYGKLVPGAQLSVSIRHLVPRQAYVLGMVSRPGPVDLAEAGTLLQALAHVGGWTTMANLKQVVVFHRSARTGPQGQPLVVDLMPVERGRPDGWTDVALGPDDVVVVPKSAVTDFGDFVDLVFRRGVYGMLPLSGNMTLNNP